MRVKIADIAKIAGLSTASVSRILNDRGGYSRATASRVMQIADELGYYKDRSASDLASQSNHTIGLIYTDSETNFNDLVIKGIMAEATINKLDTILMIAKKNDPISLTKVVRDMIERRVFGLLFVSIQPNQQVIGMLNQAGIFSQVVGASTENQVSYVSSDDFQIGYQATDYLIKAGYQRIGFAGADITNDYVGQLRLQGYRQALKTHQMTFNQEWLCEGNFSYQSGITAAKYYHNHSNVDAIIGASDETSWGLLNGFYDLGVLVPDDIAIMSIDGTELCTQTRPQLTSITQNFALMGKTAVDRLVNHADSSQTTTTSIPLKIEKRETS